MAEERDVERVVDKETFIKTLRRAADAIESGEGFRIQIQSERFTVPAGAIFAIEHEREEEDGKITEEVELQMRWSYET